MLPSLLRRIPRGIVYELEQTRPQAGKQSSVGWTRHLSTAQRRGFLYGPIAYARSRYAGRKTGVTP
jgi:hypothetical protein